MNYLNNSDISFLTCVLIKVGGTAVKVLQRAANGKGAKLKVDGGMGPATLKAVQNVEHNRVKSYRILHYANLVINKPEQEKFWYGWFKRALEV